MKLAMSRLKNIGLLALVLVVLISLYPLSLSVASVRSDLTRTEAKIVAAKQRLRYLETEFATRASMRQLELWNAVDYGYRAPEAKQYLSGERELANLGKGRDHMRDIVEVAMVDLPNAAGSVGSALEEDIPLPETEEAQAADSQDGTAVAIDLPSNAPSIEELLDSGDAVADDAGEQPAQQETPAL